MADLTTNYLGIELKNPVIAGASGLTADMKTLKEIEEAGAGAVVLKSLFEEQINLEAHGLQKELHQNDNLHAEMITVMPEIEHAGPEAHLAWVRRAAEELSIPVIASLNAQSREVWVSYARKLAETGAAALELNFYRDPAALPGNNLSPEEQAGLVRELSGELGNPLSVKLSPVYEDPTATVRRFLEAGARGAVLFNRLFEPEIDISREEHISPLRLSSPGDHRLPLRFIGLTAGGVPGDLCGSTGVFSSDGAVKLILAGAQTIQQVSALYRQGIPALGKTVRRIEAWMDQHNYPSLESFRGKLSRRQIADPWIYRRAQYVKKLMEAEPDLGFE